jgi:hypothetical protein
MVFLVVGYGREYRDLGRLYLIAIAWFTLVVTALLTLTFQ